MAANNPPKKGGIFRAYLNFNVLYKILIGLVIGAIAGVILAANGVTSLPAWISMFGTIFTRLLKMIIIPMIVGSLVVGASSVSPATVGKVGIRIILIYLLTSAFGVIIGLLMGNIFQPHAELAQVTEMAADAAGKTAESNVWEVISNIIPTSVLTSLVNETVLQVIFFSLVFGLCLSYMKVSDDERIREIAHTTFNVFDCLAEIMMKVVRGIMQYAPIGVAVLICEVFAKNGAKVAGALLTVTIACFLGYIIHVVLVYGGLLKLYKIKIAPFFKEARTPFITAFVTRSSNGTLPTTMTAAENLGVDKEVYAFSLPLGATINMDGTAIYQGVCAFFLVMSCFNRGLTFGEMGMIVLLATLASIGTAGVPGAGAIMLAMVMQGINLPIAEGTILAGAYAMILGIDAILDMGRTALNVVGDLTCTCCVAKRLNYLKEDSLIK
ncbi:MAG: dicarboxylate/amino acid:cation symporter [Oscillospiraceae bacterium]|nr:dicarboxylate/amino acid:cation symporter [Oscillospiraceae bacterium]